MAGAGLVLAFAAFLTVHKNPGTGTRTTLPVPVAVAQVPTPAQPEATRPSSAAAVAAAPAPQVTARAKSPSSPVPATSHGLKPSPTDNLYGAGTLVGTQDPEQFPAGASLRGSVEADASLRDNLRVINEVIAECQKHLKKHPNDELAREYLASAYQQKAQLVAAILDSGRSEQ
jgi:ribosomal protein S15P/S13E